MKVTHTDLGIVHLQFDTQEELCRALVRLQEFYESLYPEIRGHRFTLDEFKALYTKDHGEPFSYFTDWHGFNVPGHVVYSFMRLFRDDLTNAEFSVVDEALRDYPKGCYLIATHRDDDIDHEIAHAMYYLDSHYHLEVRKLLNQFRSTPEAQLLHKWLKREGYADTVTDDEFNAYLATNERTDWVIEHDFTPKQALAMEGAAGPFRRLFEFTLGK